MYNHVQWNLDLMKSLGTGQICLLNGGFVCYIEVIVNDMICNTGDFCRNTTCIVPMSMTYNKPLTERLLSLYRKD